MGRVLRTSILPGALSIAVLLMAPLAYGQSAPATPPQTALDILHQLSEKADVIFAGQVLAISRPTGGVVEVEFRVDQAIRGCAVGTPYIVREWAGLWIAGNQRYRVGQRLLMLLHAPSAAGMSSPVGGLDGAIPIRQGGVMPLASTVTPLQPPYVDLRWLGARLPRAVSYRSEPARTAKQADLPMPFLAQETGTSMVVSGSINSAAPIMPVFGNGGSGDASVPAQQASASAVMGMLSSWQKAQHVAP